MKARTFPTIEFAVIFLMILVFLGCSSSEQPEDLIISVPFTASNHTLDGTWAQFEGELEFKVLNAIYNSTSDSYSIEIEINGEKFPNPFLFENQGQMKYQSTTLGSSINGSYTIIDSFILNNPGVSGQTNILENEHFELIIADNPTNGEGFGLTGDTWFRIKDESINELNSRLAGKWTNPSSNTSAQVLFQPDLNGGLTLVLTLKKGFSNKNISKETFRFPYQYSLPEASIYNFLPRQYECSLLPNPQQQFCDLFILEDSDSSSYQLQFAGDIFTKSKK